MMLLKMKVQFNSAELLIKMMPSTRRPYMVVLHMRDLMRVIVLREALKA